MALGDALAVSLMEKRGFKKEDFASFHPGGSLGKRLFVKALDLARRDDLPMLEMDAAIKDAITVMTDGKLGTVLLMDGRKVKALLSDGDLRRALLDKEFNLDKAALEYATKDPKSEVADGLLASEALKSIEESKIQLLILTDREGNLEGVLHIHTLVEAGIS
jgi:arabinose-5-phosphate isomerase